MRHHQPLLQLEPKHCLSITAWFTKTVSRVLQIVSVPFLFCISSPALPNDSAIWLPYPPDGIALGQGYDILRNAKTPTVCIEYVSVADAGLETKYEISTLNSFSDVFSSLEIHSSGALDMSILRASAKLNFANQIKTTSIDERYMFSANVSRGALHVSPQPTVKRGATTQGSQDDTLDDDQLPRQVAFRSDLSTKPDFDFATQCGHGFVSAIVTGVELNAAITTSGQSSEHAAKLSGSLKLEALERLIKGTGTIEGKSAAVESLEKSQLDTFIMGGENYSLPTTLEALKEFVIRLPDLVEQHPRPIRIAISPYSTLTTGGGFDVFNNASTLRPLIYASFAAREARDRIYSIAEGINREDQITLFYNSDEVELYRRAQNLNGLMVELRETLVMCREALSNENSSRAVQVLSGPTRDIENLQNLENVFHTLEHESRNEKTDDTKIAAMVLEQTPSDSGSEEREGLDLFECVAGNSVREMIHRALENYLFSLSSMPIDVTSRDESQISKDQLQSSIEALVTGDVSKELLAADRLLTKKRAQHAHCAENIETRMNSLRLLRVGQSTLESALSKGEDLMTQCEEELAAGSQEFQSKVDSIGTREKLKILSDISTVREVLAHEIYRNSIQPILRSMCRADLNYLLCSYSYDDTMNAVRQYVGLGGSDILRLAEILGIQVVETPSPAGEESESGQSWSPLCDSPLKELGRCER